MGQATDQGEAEDLELRTHATVKAEYGWVPTSVWNVSANGAYWDAMIHDEGDADFEEGRKGRKAGAPHTIAGGEASWRFSEFLAGVASRVYDMWCPPAGTVVDPFAGRATRAIVAWEKGRTYTGYEIVPRYCELTENRIASRPLTLWRPQDCPRPTIINGDGTVMADSPDGSADLVFSCPPYWNVEQYESVPGQLSDIKQYGDFLATMFRTAKAAYRVCKDQGFAVMVVSDMRRDKVFIPFHTDMMAAYTSAGFALHDVIVSQMHSAAALGIGGYMRRRHTAKTHEYVLAFCKGTPASW